MLGLWLLCTGEVVDLFLDAVEIRPCTDGAVAQFNLPICPELLTGADVSDNLIFIM